MTSEFQPSEKSEAVEDMITHVMGKSRVATIRSGKCMTCDVGLLCRICNKSQSEHVTGQSHLFTPFRDALSAREYQIGGMCQSCQDSVFGTEIDFEDYL